MGGRDRRGRAVSEDGPPAIPREIERKYLLRGLPPRAAETTPWQIDQGYLPGDVLIERVRRTVAPDGSTRYTRTVKAGRGVARIELEEAADQTTFDVLWTLTVGRRVRKARHRVADGAYVWEIDHFLDRALDLAEIELRHTDDVVAPPDWLAPWIVREVTDEGAYTNAQLARTPTHDAST
ncbi:MAG: hypothetical protein MUE41_07035 [Gemmatimonadaceae bacterium]|nr:hypothetical protein [Gemmatimonadaceae bacterium]